MRWTRLGMFTAAWAPRGTVLAAAILALVACKRLDPPEQTAPVVFNTDAIEKLERLNDKFQRKVYPVTDGVYQAVGFGIANSIMVEGNDCVFVVDVMGSMETARAVKAEFEGSAIDLVGFLRLFKKVGDRG